MKSNDKKKLKVLHITPWYPNSKNQFEAIWIKRQIESLAPYVDQHVFHLRIADGNGLGWQHERSVCSEHMHLRLPIQRWFLFELAWFVVLFKKLVLEKLSKRADLINFHIAYPALTYWHWLKPFIKTPVLITEHWSAYHFNFGIRESRKLSRVRSIFSHEIPVVCVSKSLKEDLIAFSCNASFDSYILPNVVDVNTFYYKSEGQDANESRELFMVSQWNWPKDPQTVLRAFERWNSQHHSAYTLKIGGYGNQMEEIRAAVFRLGLADSVKLLGALSPNQIASEMRKSFAFIHCSAYETFSVVCAEALSCGTPVIASEVGGIKEFVSEQDGILVSVNSVEEWSSSLERFINRRFDRIAIAQRAHFRFSDVRVGLDYFHLLKRVSSEAY